MYTYVFIVSTNILSYFLENKINYFFNKSKKGKIGKNYSKIAERIISCFRDRVQRILNPSNGARFVVVEIAWEGWENSEVRSAILLDVTPLDWFIY